MKDCMYLKRLWWLIKKKDFSSTSARGKIELSLKPRAYRNSYAMYSRASDKLIIAR